MSFIIEIHSRILFFLQNESLFELTFQNTFELFRNSINLFQKENLARSLIFLILQNPEKFENFIQDILTIIQNEKSFPFLLLFCLIALKYNFQIEKETIDSLLDVIENDFIGILIDFFFHLKEEDIDIFESVKYELCAQVLSGDQFYLKYIDQSHWNFIFEAISQIESSHLLVLVQGNQKKFNKIISLLT